MTFGGFFGQTVSKAGDAVSDLGSQIDDTVNDSIPGGWTTVALIAGGYYYYPEISAWMAADGAVVPAAEAAAADAAATGATTSAVTGGAAGAASGVPITTAATNAATAAGVLGTSYTAPQIASMARLGLTAASLVGGANAISNATNTGTGGGLLTPTATDRSGFSSGSANYSPEYYQQVQAQYNKYMPQAKGANITNDLKNWYDTKYTPNVGVANVATGNTTGTGYTTPTSMTNLGMTSQAMLPSFTDLNKTTSTAGDVASEYAKFISSSNAFGGGNTVQNRQAAIQYLQSKGFTDAQINAGYSQYLSSMPASTGNTAQTLASNATPAQIAQAYAGFVNSSGGDTVANREKAINYLVNLGVPNATIQAAYPIYQASIAPQAGSTGMLTGAATTPTATQPPAAVATPAPVAQAQQQQAAPTAATAQPLYSALGANSDPQAIANAYSQFVGNASNDTEFNREAAVKYLTNLGISQDTLGQAYGLFKGA